jgi:15-cis-phytoene synthase/lycopene beta-cyclase
MLDREAFFFLVTNCLIVFGLVAFDNALAVLDTFSPFSSLVPDWPSPVTLIKALLIPASKYDEQRILGLQEAVVRLQGKSRSFFLASGTFAGKIRLYLVILYSFCRVADDLVDEANSIRDARDWIARLREYLDLSYGKEGKQGSVQDFVRANFPARVHSALLLLPTTHLSREPLEELLKGFEMDLGFSEGADSQNCSLYPIQNQADLDLYGARVAGTVAQLCLEIIFAQLPGQTDNKTKGRLIRAGARMGIALQYVNIARDIAVDALLHRVYVPLTWLTEEGLTFEGVIKNPNGVRIERLRARLLDRAFEMYQQSRGAIAELPVQVRGPMRVAVESYMEIGRVLREGKYSLKADRATVPKSRRIWVAWTALNGYGRIGFSV